MNGKNLAAGSVAGCTSEKPDNVGARRYGKVAARYDDR
jgi:hypothetical protein